MTLAVDLYERASGTGPIVARCAVTHPTQNDRLAYVDHLARLWGHDLGYAVEWRGIGVIAAVTRTGTVAKVAVTRSPDKQHQLDAAVIMAAAELPPDEWPDHFAAARKEHTHR